MEHTAAPWISTEEGNANFYFVMAPNNQWLMRIQQNGELTIKVQRQNMKLICTAPELLDALDKLTSMYTTMINSGDCGSWDPEKEDEVIAARLAIKKATE